MHVHVQNSVFVNMSKIRARCTILCEKVSDLPQVATGRWFSPGPPVSSTNKNERHDITEILLKVALSTIKQTSKQTKSVLLCRYIEVYIYLHFTFASTCVHPGS